MNTIQISQPPTLTQTAAPFLDYLEEWMHNLPTLTVASAFPNPSRAALISVDVIHGFCYTGALASPRVAAIVPPVVALMQAAWEHGLRQIIVTQDTHEPDAVEFSSWPAHCVRGTPEAEAVAEIKALPFYPQILTIEKNSINSGANTALNSWIAAHPAVDTFVLVGDCTDLCIYQLAMHLRTDANARQLQRRVIVPMYGVDTYDLPVETARELGILPHPAALLHAVFFYHMALNGIEVVKAIA